MSFNSSFKELEYTAKLAKLAQTTRAAITEEVRLVLIIWLDLCVGSMNQILCYDWLPKQARWRYVAFL